METCLLIIIVILALGGVRRTSKKEASLPTSQSIHNGNVYNIEVKPGQLVFNISPDTVQQLLSASKSSAPVLIDAVDTLPRLIK